MSPAEHNIPPHNIIHFLSFVSSTTAPYTTSLIISSTTAPYTSFIHNSPLHITYFLLNSPLHIVHIHLVPPQQPPTQNQFYSPSFTSLHNIIHIIYTNYLFPYATSFIPYTSFFSLHNIIYFPIIRVNFRVVSTSQCAVFLTANIVTIAHSLNPDSTWPREISIVPLHSSVVVALKVSTILVSTAW